MAKLLLFIVVLVYTSKSLGKTISNNSLHSLLPPNYESDEEECIWQCAKTSQFDPVCGSNGVTYWNIGHLYCSQSCGVDVYPLHPPPCSPIVTSTTETNSLVDAEECIRSCPRTKEYNPVCGSNRVQYENIGHLTCAQLCGVDVTLTHPAPCDF
ncbi:unnamed protein product [Chilo suppressalis]|uniref:Kazal-like domain-containing protein n=1 Tax=Chilo suppressalis TaxID=168631 RepID=A0ABN8AXD3_CHISP|nr:hypothetical protein evm_001059 [Chilo suppressalis]CAH0399730.1 unnamed protein product [Chilo suppressalis]